MIKLIYSIIWTMIGSLLVINVLGIILPKAVPHSSVAFIALLSSVIALVLLDVCWGKYGQRV
jgi:hypothetical protein